MPIYDFLCDKCGAEGELLVKHNYGIIPCKKCDGHLHRQASYPAAVYVRNDEQPK